MNNGVILIRAKQNTEEYFEILKKKVQYSRSEFVFPETRIVLSQPPEIGIPYMCEYVTIPELVYYGDTDRELLDALYLKIVKACFNFFSPEGYIFCVRFGNNSFGHFESVEEIRYFYKLGSAYSFALQLARIHFNKYDSEFFKWNALLCAECMGNDGYKKIFLEKIQIE